MESHEDLTTNLPNVYEENMNWKYAMILVEIDHSAPKGEEDICQLVEIYRLKEDGGFTSFCKASLLSPRDLLQAAKDIDRDGVNRWFYENGDFSVTSTGELDWERRFPELDKAAADHSDSLSEEEEELYKIYGGD